MTGPGGIAVGAAGGVVLLVAGLDLFFAVFNYDGFTFLTARLHRVCWGALRGSSRMLRGPLRDAYLSVGSAGMLPITLLSWLALETAGFAMMYLPGLTSGDFSVEHGLVGPQAAFYFSGGDLTTMTFGDIVPLTAPFRALVDLETVVGLTTFTIGLTYVLAAFDALGSLNALHGRVRRHAISPNQPASILARHYRSGREERLPELVQALVEDLAAYDDALRRYPVVFYFHTRRLERSVPRIYAALGALIEMLRWGLPADDETANDPSVLALENQYTVTGERLQRSFVGPGAPPLVAPLPEPAFAAAYRAGSDPMVRAFAGLRRDAARAVRREREDDPAHPELYRQYAEWLAFHAPRVEVARRLRVALCYRADDDAADGTAD